MRPFSRLGHRKRAFQQLTHRRGSSIPAGAWLYDDFYGDSALASRVPRARPNSTTWAVSQGAAAVQSGTLQTNHSASGTFNAYLDPGVADIQGSVRFRFSAVGSAVAAIMLRQSSTGNFIRLTASSSLNNYRVVLRSSSTDADQGNTVSKTFLANTWYTLNFSCNGNTISFDIDGGTVATATVATHSTNTRHGLWAFATLGSGVVIEFDNFDVYEYADVLLTVADSGIANPLSHNIKWVANPNTWREAAWSTIVTTVGATAEAQGQHLNPFGNGVYSDWDGVTPATPPALPNNLYGETNPGTGTVLSPSTNSFMYGWNAMRATDSSAALHWTLFKPPWWMTGSWDSAGVMTPHAYADRHDAEKARLLNEYADEWEDYVAHISAIIFAPPYNVRYVSIHNELKDFWGGYLPTPKWDMRMNNSPMGYARYHQICEAGMQRGATAAGVSWNNIKICGPYCVIRHRGTDTSSISAGHPYASVLRGRSWGWIEKHGIIAIDDYLPLVVAHGLKLDVISVDLADYSVNGVYIASDDWAMAQLWEDIFTYLEGVQADNGIGPLEIVIDEAYRYPVIEASPTNQFRAALKVDTFNKLMFRKTKWWVSWGLGSNSFESTGSRIVSDSTGAVEEFGEAMSLYKTHAPTGTTIYQVTPNDTTKASAVATNSKLLITNKTASTLKARRVGSSTVHSIAAHDIVAVDR